MRVVVLSSGSKGNTTYVETENVRLLIDFGNSCKYVCDRLKEIGVDPNSIDGIMLSHTHSDHIKGLKVFEAKYEKRVYMGRRMIEELDYLTNYEFVDDEFLIKDLKVTVIHTSHDAVDSRGYLCDDGKSSMVQITDTGYINQRYFEILKNRDFYVMESNHDIEMLNNGPYSFLLRQRILGDKGHLSNYDSAKYLGEFIGEKTKSVVLAHLSMDNNTYDKAYETLVERLDSLGKNKCNIVIAKQDQMTDIFDF